MTCYKCHECCGVAGVTDTEMCDVRQREREGHCVRNQFFVNREVSGGDWATPHQLRQQASVFYWII